MRNEFDHYIANYREEQDKVVSFSGETSEFFAVYKTEKLMAWFPELINNPISILDFGCGDGLMTHYVQQAFYQATVIGIDPSGKSIEEAQKLYPSIEFKQTLNEHLPFADETFDLIFAAGVFHHIPFNEHQAHLDEIMRVLKPGGSFVLFELNPLNPLTVFTFRRNPIDKDAHMLPFWKAKTLLKHYGSQKLVFYCFFPKPLSWLRRIEPYLTKLPLGALYAIIVKH